MELYNGLDFQRGLKRAFKLVSDHEEELNRLNVFPVPDGDTGLNMTRSLAPVLNLESAEELDKAAKTASKKILAASRGNSGTILATYFMGLSQAFTGVKKADSKLLVKGFFCGSEQAYTSVFNPEEGTILTVMKDVGRVEPQKSIEATLLKMLETAEKSFKNTINILPVLKKNNVIDAGGLGFYYIVKGLLEAALGLDTDDKLSELNLTAASGHKYFISGLVKKSQGYFGLEGAKTFKDQLAGLGNSLSYAESQTLIRFGLSSDDSEAVFNAAGRFGTLLDFKADNSRLSGEEKLETAKVGFVSVIQGDGFEAVYRDFDVRQAVVSSLGREASFQELKEAALNLHVEKAVLLPNSRNTISTANLLSKMSDGKIVCLPTEDESQGVLALEHFDPEEPIEVNLNQMLDALKETKFLKIAIAEKSYVGKNIQITEGDHILLEDSHPLFKGKDDLALFETCLAQLAGYKEITIYYGDQISLKEAEEARQLVAERLKGVLDVILVEGNQPLYRYFIVAEKE
jgi:DAK2 domain fusion protein YloV